MQCMRVTSNNVHKGQGENIQRFKDTYNHCNKLDIVVIVVVSIALVISTTMLVWTHDYTFIVFIVMQFTTIALSLAVCRMRKYLYEDKF